MATSVPVPIASPRSAWASAGASLTPSPTIATTRPSACRRRTTSALSAGSTSAMTSSIPTSAATARAVASLSPVSSTGRSPSALQRRDRLGGRRLDGVGDDEHGAHLAVPGGQRRRCGRAASAAGSAASSSAGMRRLHSRHQRRAADEHAVAVDDALDAEALAVGEALDGAAARRAPRARRWAIACAIGCSEASSSAPARRSTSSRAVAVGERHVDERHLARSSRCRSCRARSCRPCAWTRGSPGP